MIRKTQKGSALVYILIAIALLAALTATFMDGSSTQTTSQRTFDTVTELNSQINFIRSAIQECVLTYPKGDTTMPAAPALVGGFSVVRPYPLAASNTYLSSPTAMAHAESIRCPGNPGNSNNHVRIFGSSSGKFLPPNHPLLDQWWYFNNADGVYLVTLTSATDAFLDTAFQKIDSQFAPCEVQYIKPVVLTNIASFGSGGGTCAANYKCLIVRIVTTPSTIYHGEACP